jgi:opacity protein-like surface antigen
MKKIILTLFVMLLCTQISTQAEGVYFGSYYHRGIYNESGLDPLNFSAIGVSVGKKLTPNISLEARYFSGLTGDDFVLEDLDLDLAIDLESAFSIFFKGDIPFNDNLNLYGLVGYTSAQFKTTARASNFSFSSSSSTSDFSLGGGMEVQIRKNLLLGVEYVMYLYSDTYTYSGINLGLKYQL